MIVQTDFVVGRRYFDSLSRHSFTVEWFKDVGGRGIVFTPIYDEKQVIKRGERICMYSQSRIEFDLETYHNQIYKANDPRQYYSVFVKKDAIVIPKFLHPDLSLSDERVCFNLGMLANGAMQEDPLRNKNNARLVVSYPKDCPPLVSLKATQNIYSGTEIVLAYGAKMINSMRNE